MYRNQLNMFCSTSHKTIGKSLISVGITFVCLKCFGSLLTAIPVKAGGFTMLQ